MVVLFPYISMQRAQFSKLCRVMSLITTPSLRQNNCFGPEATYMIKKVKQSNRTLYGETIKAGRQRKYDRGPPSQYKYISTSMVYIFLQVI